MAKAQQIIGLTGGIACGKSTVSAYLKEQGIPVIDADVVARQIVEPGTKGLAQIAETFGNAYLNPDGTLNRAMLGAFVFSDPEALQTLNGITKPLLVEAIKAQIQSLQHHPRIVLDIALLLEDDAYKRMVDTIWLVTVSPEQQLARLMARNGYSDEEARQRIHSQMSDAERRTYAHIIIDNSGTVAETLAQVEQLLYNETQCDRKN